ncbi:MAG: glutamate formimidoyltransferase [Spirochaetes bacterium]|nr:MAG: glutamate formimidoyltransferase [Spirochaetota bacterium]
MGKIVECVPNFSEGRDKSVIDSIAAAISSVDGIKLLNVDMGYDTNRTVVTFAGDADVIVEAGFRGIKKASELIDMSKQTGEHPRMGATDVFPFIPLSGISADECLVLAEELAKKVGDELGIPIYLYAKSAKKKDRVRLPDIRAGEYEALEEKIKSGEFNPDYGPAVFNPGAGVTAVGVRDFLLAYNINLSTRDKKIASDIALTVREKGRAKRDGKGVIIRDSEGKAVKVPGRLSNCQAGGWYIDEYGYAQVTMNLTSFPETGLHKAFDIVAEEAVKRGVRVTGSEAIGLLPRDALLDAGKYYLEKMGKNTGIPEKEIIHNAVLSLGLNDTSPFNPSERVVEYALQGDSGALTGLTLIDFIDELSSDSMAPGGGSVSALSGALSAGLTSMVANLTFGKKGYEPSNQKMKDISIRAQELKVKFLSLVEADTNAFNNYISALRLPKKSENEITARAAAIESASKTITLVPLDTLRLCREIIDLAEIVLKRGNKNALSDAFVGVSQANTAGEGAYLNIKINFPGVKDKEFVAKVLIEADLLIDEISKIHKRLFSYVRKNI